MNLPFDPIALTLVPSIAFAVAAMWHFCVLTKDHKSAWFVPGSLALAFGVSGTFQAAALLAPTPVELVRSGAFYAPLALWSEPWRFLSSLFIYDDPVIALFTSLVIAIVGCRLVQHVGLKGFVFTFGLSTIAGTLAAATTDPQSLGTGATAASFGLVTATLLFGGWRASAYVERIARGTALAFVVVSLARFLATENMIGTLHAAGGIAASVLAWATYRQSTRVHRTLSAFGSAALVTSAALLVPPAADFIGRAETTRARELETWARLAGLQSARDKNWIDDGELADRMKDEVLAPLDDIIEQSTSWTNGQTKWIVKERDLLVGTHARLSVLAEILRAKQKLVDAEAAEDERSRTEKLDSFWHALPAASREISLIPLDDRIREGAAYDLTLLRQTANDLEIWSLESALNDLRDQVVEDGPRSPASTLPWNDIRQSWLERRVRLERLSPDTPEQTTRVNALKERLAQAIDAIQ